MALLGLPVLPPKDEEPSLAEQYRKLGLDIMPEYQSSAEKTDDELEFVIGITKTRRVVKVPVTRW
jgi:hypothetical protein